MKRLIYYILALTTPIWAQTSPVINSSPTREFGQPQLLVNPNTAAPNYVEGRELYQPGSVAIDTTSSPPILYVADTLNNRVLAWQNPGSPATCGISNPQCGFASLVIGQRDLFSTLALGPSSPLSSGLSFPTAVAVDSSGNLYVSDVGNNRVLRFPAPFKQAAATQAGALFTVDLVIGQTSVSAGNQANQGLSAPTASTLAFSNGSTALVTGLAINPTTGDLWVTDAGNNRVLGFPKASLVANTSPAATMVLGQPGLTTSQTPSGVQNKTVNPNNIAQLFYNVVSQPAGVAFDQKGRLYVADNYSRVLFFDFTAGFLNGMSATAILGVDQQVTATTPTFLPYPNQYTLGLPVSSTNTALQPPQGVFTLGNNLFVADTYANRIVEYDQPQNWMFGTSASATAANPSPAILSTNLIGQVSLTALGGYPNEGNASPSATTVYQPVAGAFNSADSSMWIADAGNNRVLKFPSQSGAYQTASAVIGQLDFIYNAPNLIEGKEVYFVAGSVGAAGMVIDANSTPPHLYVADYGNNRILGFNDYRTVQQGSKADIVIGQPNLYTSVVNYPRGGNTSPILPEQTGLFKPIGLVVDSGGNLYVADSGNGRVVRFPAPFTQAAGQVQTANLVLGQADFSSSLKNASPQNMSTPWGLALFSDGSLAVSDSTFNRVLIFKHAAGADFTNGQNASIVLGQQDFVSIQPAKANGQTPASTAGMNTPAHIATDTSDRLYVCDSLNNRLLVFTNARNASNGVASVFQQPSLSTPEGVIVSPLTGEIWIGNTNANQVLRLPEFTTLELNGPQITATIPALLPLTLALDPASNIIVADAFNRVTFYYALLAFQNAANFNSQPLAPGMIALLYRFGQGFGTQDFASTTASTLPWPTNLSDIQVSVNGIPAPIYSLNPGAGFIAFQIPFETPVSGNVNFIVMHPSTGEIVAAAPIPMAQQNPGFLTQGPGGSGQVAAFNAADGTVNGPSNPVARGQTISFCLTGQGTLPGAPADGAAPTSAASTPATPVLYVNGVSVPVQYSGVGCGYPGLWQINAMIPFSVAPTSSTSQTTVILTLNDTPSNTGANGLLNPANGNATTFWVK